VSDLEFNPLDQEFVSKEVIQRETVQMLAQLELEKHKLRMQMVLSGTGEAQIQNGVSINKALENIERSMISLKSKFVDVLVPDSNAGTQ
jgi:hypothetical protein